MINCMLDLLSAKRHLLDKSQEMAPTYIFMYRLAYLILHLYEAGLHAFQLLDSELNITCFA